MRPHGKTKLGFFPLAVPEAERLKKCLTLPPDFAALDPRNRPLPNEAVAEICEALWQEGINPNRRIVQQRMPVWNDHAFGPGIVAWRKQKGLSEQGTRVGYALPTNLSELAKIISPAIARAPLTSYDPAGHGRWRFTPAMFRGIVGIC